MSPPALHTSHQHSALQSTALQRIWIMLIQRNASRADAISQFLQSEYNRRLARIMATMDLTASMPRGSSTHFSPQSLRFNSCGTTNCTHTLAIALPSASGKTCTPVLGTAMSLYRLTSRSFWRWSSAAFSSSICRCRFCALRIESIKYHPQLPMHNRSRLLSFTNIRELRYEAYSHDVAFNQAAPEEDTPPEEDGRPARHQHFIVTQDQHILDNGAI